MLKLSRNGIGALTAQYRSVLRKCLFLNMWAAGMFALFPAAANATVYDSASTASDTPFQYMGQEILSEDKAYVHGSAAYNLRELFSVSPHNDAWLRNRGDTHFGYDTSGSTVDSTVVSDKHNLTHKFISNQLTAAANGGGVLSNMNESGNELNIYKTEFNNNSDSRFLDDYGSPMRDSGMAAGGAIVNYSEKQANIVNSSFNYNYVMHFYNAAGGAIYNGSNLLWGVTPSLGSIEASSSGVFANNHAGNEWLVNNSDVTQITSGTTTNILNPWKNNSVDTAKGDMTLTATGGAIHNVGSFIIQSYRFDYNHAIGKTSKGGAIYNDKIDDQAGVEPFGGVMDINGISTFVGNYVGEGLAGDSGASTFHGEVSLGGAIYNDGDLNIAGGSGNQVLFTNVLGEESTDGNFAIGTVTAAGGAIYNDTNGNIDAIRNNSLFIKNYVQALESGNSYGGAIANYGKIAMQGGYYDRNKALAASGSAQGGAIYNASSGTITLQIGDDSEFTSNSAKQGGAIYNDGTIDGTVNAGNFLFDGNSADTGGAIYNNNKIENTFINSSKQTFNLNTALSGGAIYNNGTITNTYGENAALRFTNNSANTGGAIYNNTSKTITFDVSGSALFSGNEAKTGGAVYNAGNFASANNNFNSNVAFDTTTSKGGAIYNAINAKTDLSGTLAFYDNVAGEKASSVGVTAQGGAIYNDGNLNFLTGDNSVYFGNDQSVTGSLGNHAIASGTAAGGAIYNTSSGNINNITAESVFKNNYAQGIISGNSYGGAIANYGKINLQGGTYDHNQALAANGTAQGGAIYNADTGTLTLQISDDSEYISNSAKQGGAIYNNGTLNGTVSAGNLLFSGNSADTGGAIYNNNKIENTLTNNARQKFNSNTAQSGGAIYNNGTITNTYGANNVLEFNNNSADNGGAIYNNASKTITFNVSGNALFSGNEAKTGGAVYNGGNFASGNNYFSSNSAFDTSTAKGGAIYNALNAKTDLSGVLAFYGNTAGEKDSSVSVTAQGGAVYNDGNLNFLTDNNSVYFGNNQSVVGSLGNHAVASGTAAGGAIYNTSSGTINNITAKSVFKNNYAQATGSGNSYGGAIANQGNITVKGGTYEHNQAIAASGNAQGGAIYNASSATITLQIADDSEFTSNSAKQGGAIYNDGTLTGTVTASSFLFNGNSAGSGGAIYNNGTITNSYGAGNTLEFSNNSADTGGAVYNNASKTITFNVSGNALFSKNEAKTGGAVYNAGNFASGNNSFNSNVAFDTTTAKGGAIYNALNAKTDLSGTLAFYGNVAGEKASSISVTAQGGAVYNDGNLNFLNGTNSVYFGNDQSVTGSLGNHAVASGTAAGGAIFNTANGVINNITDKSVFKNNYAQATSSGNSYGGAIANQGNITIKGGTYDQNQAISAIGNAQGGAIYNAGSGAVTLQIASDTEFTSNSAKQGGAIYNEGTLSGTVSAGNLFLGGNSANTGGAIYNSGTVSSTYNSSNTLEFSNNSATSLGGAIYNDDQIENIFTNGAKHKFNSNTAQSGGAIYNNGTIINSYAANSSLEFRNNSANIGGAVYNNDSKTITFDVSGSALFSENEAKTGGAVYNAGNFASGNNNFSSNVAFDTYTAKGGAIYNALDANTDLSGTLAFYGNVAGEKGTSVSATAQGGAVYNDGNFNLLTGNNSVYFGNDQSVTGSLGNHAVASGTAAGGAIYNTLNGVINSLTAKSVFKNNYAQATGSGNSYGGAIANYGGLIVQGGTYDHNQAIAASGEAQGGAIYNASTGTVALQIASDAEFTSNSAKKGGAIYNDGNLNGTVSGGTFSFNGNSADMGGAVYNNNKVENTFTNSAKNKFTSNSAQYGGAIYNNGTFTNTYGANNTLEFSNNSATSLGGAIYNAVSKNLTLNVSGNALFSSNTAQNGGAVYNLGNYTSGNSVFKSNVASGTSAANGGAFYNALNAKTDLSGSLAFYGNSAEGSSASTTVQGGAIYNNGNFNFLTGNNSVYFGNDQSVAGSLGNHVVASNYALGGAIYNESSGIINSLTANSVFKNNYAQGTGDGVSFGGAVANYGKITVQGGTYDHNQALADGNYALGGAVYNNGTITMQITDNSEYTSNSAKQGGAIFNDGTISGSVSAGNLLFSGNSANIGGAIYNNNQIENTFSNNAKHKFTSNTAQAGGAIYNGGTINNTYEGNASLEFEGNTASSTVGSVAQGNSIYNATDGNITFTLNNNAQIHFGQNQSVYHAGSSFEIIGSNDSPVLLTGNQVAAMAGGNTQVLLDTTLYSDANTALYTIRNTNLILSQYGYIDSTAVNSYALNDTALDLRNNNITLQSGSYMNLNSGNDTLNNNNFSVASNANLRYKNQNGNPNYLANTITNNGRVTYYSYADDTDIHVAHALVNSNVLDVAADKLLTNIHIDNLNSKTGNQIVVNLRNSESDTANSKSDIIVIDNEIHNTSGTPTSVVFNDMNNSYISQVYLGEGERIYFAQTQVAQTDYDFNNTFITSAKNDNYEIKLGYETNGAVYDWFLYREISFGPEDVALVDLPRAAIEQTRSILLPLSRTNRDLYNCYQDDCDNSFCQYEHSRVKRRLWATPIYRKGSYDKPIETDFTIKGIDFGMDVQPTHNDMIGAFGSYRNGTYENDGNKGGKKYFSQFGSELDITSIVGGLYYRKYIGDFYMLGAVYGGKLDVDLKTDTNVKATIDGHTVGAQAAMGYDARLTHREVLTPSLTATYNYIKFKDANDVNGKKASIGAVNNVELEAALKYEYQFNNQYQLPTTGYIKPSVIQTIANGGKVKINEKEYDDTVYNETLGRIEIGADAELIRNFSIGAFGNYTFGSEYNAWGIGGNIRYVW